jgi:hypothetical protein
MRDHDYSRRRSHRAPQHHAGPAADRGLGQDGESCELTRFVMRGDMTGLACDVPAE